MLHNVDFDYYEITSTYYNITVIFIRQVSKAVDNWNMYMLGAHDRIRRGLFYYLKDAIITIHAREI